jgi:hypothetical protein
MEAATGFEPVIRVLQTHALPLGYAAKIWSGRRGSNPRPPPWQGGVLPLNYFRKAGVPGFEPGRDGIKTRCLTAWLYPNNKLGRTRGIEPPSAGITIRCVNHFATTANIEFKNGRGSRNRTHIGGFGDLCSTVKLCP